MSTSMDRLAKELKAQITASDNRKTKPYDSQAEVLRVEGNIAWVHIPGGVQETPVRLTMNAKKGDMVNIHVANGTAWITGNSTSPPTDDTKANIAQNRATKAIEFSEKALDDASRAMTAADTAEMEAGRAKDAAQEAWDYADSAHTAAETAEGHAQAAIADAGRAQQAAETAEGHAQAAIADAGRAYTAAETATGYANDALTQLGVVEEVVDVLSWISEHGTYKKSTDTAVVEHKMYFTLTGTVVVPETYDNGTKKITNLESYYERINNVYVKTSDTTYNPSKTYYTVSAELVANPAGNPSANNYYEIFSIDKAVQNYISSHLALTDSGLWVVKDNQGYKVLLANDGLRIYDSSGHLVSTFGESITFDSARPQTIGNSSTYIKWYDSNNDHVADSIEIAGANVNIASSVTIGGMPTKVSDLENDSDYQTGTEVSGAISTATNGLLSGVTTKDRYYLSTSSSSATGGSWQDTVPTWSSGKYIWTRVATTKTTSSGSNTTYSTAVYDSALTKALSDANGAASTVTTTKQYYLSTSSSSATGGSWSGNIPTWSSGKYIWIRFKIDKTTVGGSASTSYSPSENGQYDSALTTALSTASSAQSAANGAVASTVSCYYRSTAQSTPSISASTSIGTSANTDNAWEYVMPQPKRGCYFYTCEEYTPVSGTKTYSTVRPLDNATYTSKWCSESDNIYIDGGAIYANSVTADKMAANSITIGNMDSATQEGVLNSNIEIGGRNLFGYGSQCKALDGFWTVGAWNIATEDGYQCAHTSGAESETRYLQSKLPFYPRPNETVAISAFVKIKNISYGTTNPMCEFYLGGQTIDGTWRSQSIDAIYVDGVKVAVASTNPVRFTNYISDTNWHHIAFVRTWQNYAFTDNMLPSVYLRDATGDLYVRNIKYERGNKATDWTPAPEDVDAGIANAAQTATSYLTVINGTTGISVHNATDENNFVNVNSSGMKVYKGGTSDSNVVASFGDSVRIGKEAYGHVYIDSYGLYVKANEDGSTVSGSTDESYITSNGVHIGNNVTRIFSTHNPDVYSGDGANSTFVECHSSNGIDSVVHAQAGIHAIADTLNKESSVTVHANDDTGDTYTIITGDNLYVESNTSISGSLSINDVPMADFVTAQGTSDIWTYRKWNSGIAECWGAQTVQSTTYAANGGYKAISATLPSGLFATTPDVVLASGKIDGLIQTSMGFTSPNNASTIQTYLINRAGSSTTQAGKVYWHVKGRWK